MILKIEKLNTGYGHFQVLHDATLEIPRNKITAIIGPNGSGKSTILKAVIGIIPVWTGSISLEDNFIHHLAISRRILAGVTYSPQGNIVFDELNVKENLEIAGYLLPKSFFQDRLTEVLELFPVLKKRYKQNAGTLSGGEQQMLALARALIPKPKLLLLDEPSLGLSPNLVKDTFQMFEEIKNKQDLTLLIVEQKVNEILAVSDYVYGVKQGEIVYQGNPQTLIHQKQEKMEIFL